MGKISDRGGVYMTIITNDMIISKKTSQLLYIVGNPNRKKMHIFGFVGIFEYIC